MIVAYGLTDPYVSCLDSNLQANSVESQFKQQDGWMRIQTELLSVPTDDETFDKRFTIAVDVEGLSEGQEKLQVFKEDQLFNRYGRFYVIELRR